MEKGGPAQVAPIHPLLARMVPDSALVLVDFLPRNRLFVDLATNDPT